jgi:hypothetical protein
VVLTIAAGSAALSASLGMFGLGGSAVPVGEQRSVVVPEETQAVPTPEVETVYVDVPSSAEPGEAEAPGPEITTDPFATETPEASDDHEQEDDHTPEPSDDHPEDDHSGPGGGGEDDD